GVRAPTRCSSPPASTTKPTGSSERLSPTGSTSRTPELRVRRRLRLTRTWLRNFDNESMESVPGNTAIERWTRLILRLRWLVLGIWLALLIAGGFASTRLSGLLSNDFV